MLVFELTLFVHFLLYGIWNAEGMYGCIVCISAYIYVCSLVFFNMGLSHVQSMLRCTGICGIVVVPIFQQRDGAMAIAKDLFSLKIFIV